jgi:protein-S-isoprenylcysteine O-methyltransferase Ste14
LAGQTPNEDHTQSNGLAPNCLTVSQRYYLPVYLSRETVLVCPVALIIYGVYLRRWEERGLVARFGEDYVAYRRQDTSDLEP